MPVLILFPFLSSGKGGRRTEAELAARQSYSRPHLDVGSVAHRRYGFWKIAWMPSFLMSA
ncbi:MAG: hypothetical protein M1379_15090 [Firmicutes bacterium]|nr:hypothetical protein [Bacillota bacterium]